MGFWGLKGLGPLRVLWAFGFWGLGVWAFEGFRLFEVDGSRVLGLMSWGFEGFCNLGPFRCLGPFRVLGLLGPFEGLGFLGPSRVLGVQGRFRALGFWGVAALESLEFRVF